VVESVSGDEVRKPAETNRTGRMGACDAGRAGEEGGRGEEREGVTLAG